MCRSTSWALVLLAVSALQVAGQDNCRVVARLDGSAVKHAVAGAGVYGASRILGASKAQSAALGVGANLVKEVLDRCGSGFDVGDLGAGVAGVLAATFVEAALSTAFSDPSPVGVDVASLDDRPVFGIFLRFGL